MSLGARWPQRQCSGGGWFHAANPVIPLFRPKGGCTWNSSGQPACVLLLSRKKKETDPHTTREETTGLEREWPGDKKEISVGISAVGQKTSALLLLPPQSARGGAGWAGWRRK